MKPILIVCLWLAPFGLRAEEVIVSLQVQRNSSSLQLTLNVQGESDSDTQALSGAVVLAVDCSAPLAAASLRNFRVRAVTNFNLHLSYGFLGDLSGSVSDLEIRHGDPSAHQPYESVAGGLITFREIPNTLDGSATYRATGLPCVLIQGAGRPCNDTILLANQATSPIGEFAGSLTLSNGILRFTGSFDFGPLTIVEGATLSGVGTVTAHGVVQPCLRIERGPDEHRVSYSSAFRDFRLARTGSLSTPVPWEAAVPDSIVDDGTSVTARFRTVPDNMSFYRLELTR